MRALLLPFPEGVPDECLIARVMGRRSFLADRTQLLQRLSGQSGTVGTAPWRAGLADGSEAWVRRALQHEYFRMFRWMEERLRCRLLPLFWLEEVKTIGICLRALGRSGTDKRELLGWSLLGTPLRKALTASDGILTGIGQVSEVLVRHDPGFARLPELYAAGGTAAVEAALEDISLKRFLPKSDPLLDRYIRLTVDIANLTAAVKAWRWRLPETPPLMEGGTLRRSIINDAARSPDGTPLSRLADGLAGTSPAGGDDEPEKALAVARKKVLARLARDPDRVGVIIEYLWRCRLEAETLGVLSRKDVAGFDMIDREVAA